MKEQRKRILVAMSGGVDSSLAAALLVEAGHEVIGATMKTFCYSENAGPSKTCCGLDGIQDARRVADHLGIPHYVFDVEEEFTRDVIDDFVAEYAQGRTPNPCVRCNSNTKFRDLLRRGKMLGCDEIATGHYVRIEHPAIAGETVRENGAKKGLHSAHLDEGTQESALLRGLDREKDQAYFLWGLPRELLSVLNFPLGGYTKPEVREQARALALATSEKPESQEICFVPAGDYREFLEKRLPARHPAFEAGKILTTEGEVLGEHRGYAGFTVGQRKGLGGGFPEAMFVLEIRPESREVVVGPRDELFSTGMRVQGTSWLTHSPPKVGEEIRVQIRHRAADVSAHIVDADPEEGALDLHFIEPQRAVTPGQSAAIFQGDRLLGGGRIARALVMA